MTLENAKETVSDAENISVTTLAGILYDTYCEAVGGKAFNGDSLPLWEEFEADPRKKKQSDAWKLVASTAKDWTKEI